MPEPQRRGPLAGMRVIDLAHVMAGPTCARMLADMGADVVKVEKADGGDDTRRMLPPDIKGEPAAYMMMNRNKRGIVLDLKDRLTYGGMLPKVLQAAQQLAANGINAEVVDLRVLRPLDAETFLTSVRKTHRAVIVDEGWRSGSLAAEISARIMEQAFYDLDAPVQRVCSEEVPIPYPKHLEEAALPQVSKIETAVRSILIAAAQ